ncbi:hypothetical protein JTB14_021523 [Gonioctena quinquepunctata]|nr:hypothetical protein JTB14_021523 [Gonioctena quinquepunctata]
MAILQLFWYEDIQAEMNEKLRKERNTGGSLVHHFLRCMTIAKHFTPSCSEQQIIQKFARLFSPNVSSSLISTDTVAEALERLREADAYFNNTNNVWNMTGKTSLENNEQDYSRVPNRFVSKEKIDNEKNNGYSRVAVITTDKRNEEVDD